MAARLDTNPNPMNSYSALRAIRDVLADKPDIYVVNEGANTLDFGRDIIDMHQPRKEARYDKLIEAFDGAGYNVNDPRSLAKALIVTLASGKPALINCIIDPSESTESGHLQNLNPQSQVGNRKEA